MSPQTLLAQAPPPVAPPATTSGRTTIVPLWNQISDLFRVDNLSELISAAVELLLILAIIISLIFLITGAISWITSEGKPEKLEKARNHVTHAIVGLIIAIAAYSIWLLVVKDFLGIDVEGGIRVGSTTSGGTGGTGGTGGPGSCGSVPIGSCVEDGGAGGYCNGGIAYVQCHGPDTHARGSYSYPHFDPCSCKTGTQNSFYDWGSCSSCPP